MVTWFLISLGLLLMVDPVSAAGPGRQLCLSCHQLQHGGYAACTVCHRGNPNSERKNIAHQRLIAGRYARFTRAEDPLLQEGKRLLDRYACRRCHVIGGRGNRLSVNLDQMTNRRLPGELSRSIRQPVQNMPDFRVTEQQAVALINGLFSVAGPQVNTSAAGPQVVHFNKTTEAGKDLFSLKCGACHRGLSVHWGALGWGNNGPNLSGLLTLYYPKTFRNKESWNNERLRRWLENPRAVKPEAGMQPVRLTEAELTKLVEIVGVEQID